MAAEDEFEPYLGDCMSCFKDAAVASLTLGADVDEELIYSSLRENLLEGYIGMIHGISRLDDAQCQDYGLQMYHYIEAMT